jgi:PEP-CTERM motif
MTRKIAVAAGLMLAAWAAQGSPILINGTGVNTSGGLDQSYQIISDTTGEVTAPAQASVVTLTALNWISPIGGTAWISPMSSQSNFAHASGCCMGTDIYQTTFSLPASTIASLSISFLADDFVTIKLNGVTEFSTGTGEFYTSVNGPVTITTDFVSGLNTLQFVVSNTNSGGPTGLDASVSGTFEVVPEPTTTGLLGSGLMALAFIAWRRKQAVAR